MVCSNCGNTLKENEKFCTLCGTYNDPSNSLESDVKTKNKKKKKKEASQDEFFDDFSPIEGEELSDDDYVGDSYEEFDFEDDEENTSRKKGKRIVQEYNPKDDPDVVAYIGEDYKWIAERPFNIYALLLSWIYFLYRKLYLIGMIGLAITGVIYKFFPAILIPYIVLSMVGSGLAFNKIYLDIVEDRVAKLQNKSRGIDDMELLCKKKGGVTVIMPLIIFMIFLVVMLSSYSNFKIKTNQKEPNYWEATSDNTANCTKICREFYDNSKTSEETMGEFGCEVISNTKGEKYYNIYIRSTKNGNTRYVLYEYDPNGYVTLKGDTEYLEQLEKLEKAKTISENDEEFLKTTRLLPNELTSIKKSSESEDNMIKRYENTAPKTHFYFIKDDLYK
ncbi:MAG: zinc-ribbon domain-containing protein [Bacilli bacterium]|nr:zinc-ribbon domain-containing protein [Bacilli bacterium]